MYRTSVILTLFIIPAILYSQSVGINNTNADPDPSAILDVNSSSQGILFPRMGTDARESIDEPAEGLIVWDTSTNSIWGFDGTEWTEISSKWIRSGSDLFNANDGNVGIGESSPSYSLYVKKNIPNIALYDADNPAFSGVIQGDTNNLEIRAARVLLPFSSSDPGNVVLQASQSLGNGLVSAAGNVGIGTYDPVDKLSLSGSLGLFNGSARYGYIYRYLNDMVMNADLGNVFTNNADDLLLQTYTGTSILARAGNVGIGVINPEAKLHVSGSIVIGSSVGPAQGYALSVDGKIMAEEMRIQDSGSWPDYVFESEYQLPSLDSVRSLITSYGHLPGIPAAEEIESNGIPVGKMQRLHMEKIEELTLYILQLHERIELLEEQILQQQK